MCHCPVHCGEICLRRPTSRLPAGCIRWMIDVHRAWQYSTSSISTALSTCDVIAWHCPALIPLSSELESIESMDGDDTMMILVLVRTVRLLEPKTIFLR
eukprot:scaffold100378_cov63-Attheya_sp.AAC.4